MAVSVIVDACDRSARGAATPASRLRARPAASAAVPRHALARAAPAEGSPMDTRHAPESGAPDAPLPAHPPASYAPESPYRIFDLA
ncbi:poly-beta-hydroxybutyrate polymerase, partial [Burkholderia pseudomallei]